VFSSQASEAGVLLPMLNYLDAPRHGELRRLVSRAFTPGRISALEAHVEDIADRLMDSLIAAGGGDLISGFAGPLAAAVVGGLIGIPDEQLDAFRHLTDRLMYVGQRGSTDELAAVATAIYGMFTELLAARRNAPGDDLMSALLSVQNDGGDLSDEEVLGFCFLLVGGGNDTTANLIANGWVLLLDHPDQYELVGNDESMLPGAIEEMLRMRPPAESHARTTIQNVELHGAQIPAGARVQVLWGAANLDEREFVDPLRFDIRRKPLRHLTFGQGPHFCLGAALGRLEAQVAFRCLFRRLQGATLLDRPVRLRSPWACAFEAVNLVVPARV
jgi:cytochrome P450 family 130